MALPPELADLESRLARRLDAALDDYRRAVEQRLRDAGDRIAQAARDLPAPSRETLFADLEVGALDLGSRRAAAREAATALLAALRELDRARTQAETLDVLLDRALGAADRAALLLVRDGELVGWGERGFGAAGFAARHLELGRASRLLATRGCLRFEAGEAAALLEELGVAGWGAAAVVPLVLRDRVAALLWADRREGEPELALLQILVAAAAQRLELAPLSDRARTPTLYDETDAQVAVAEPLPLWSAAEAPAAPAAEPAAEPEVAEAAEPEPVGFAAEPTAFEPAPTGLAPWEPLAEEPAPPAFEEAGSAAEGAVEELFEAAPAEPVEAAEPEPAPLPEFEYASEEPEAGARTAAFETWNAPSADLLGTVRMPLPQLGPPVVEEAAPAPPPPTPAPPPIEEKTAPYAVLRDEPASGAGTHEIPLPGTPPAAEPDLSEDATMLSLRRPELPEPPPPLAAPPAPTPPAPFGGAEEDPHDRTSSRGRTTQVAPPPDVQGPGLAFVGGRARAVSDSPVHEEAKRLARLLISEIKLYNEEQVLEGRRNRDLYHRLREDIDRSRQIFEERVDPTVRSESDYFQQELVRSLAGGDPRALGI